jgi:hypothetical protein
MSARRCIHTGVTLPECSCLSCNREKVRRYAPELIAGRQETPSPKRPSKHAAGAVAMSAGERRRC